MNAQPQTVVLFILLIRFSQSAPNESYAWNNVVTGGGGGCVQAIIFNAKQKDLVYARTDIGGAYRWNASDQRWTPLQDFFNADDYNLYGVESLASDPVEPNRVYVAAGMYTNDWVTTNGEILRSADYGRTWERTKLSFKLGANMPGNMMGERLAVDPNRNSIIFFGARSGHGLWRSADFGATFARVVSFTAEGNYSDPGSRDFYDPMGEVWVVFDPKTGSSGNATQTIYVGIADNTGDNIFRTTDGGSTWSAVPKQPTGYLPHHAVLTADGWLFVSYNNGAGPFDGDRGQVWKLNTATGVWTDISPVPSGSADSFGYGGLAVDRSDPKVVMVAALNAWWPDVVFWRSVDGGQSWTRVWDWDTYPKRKLRYAMDISAAPWLDFGNKSPTDTDPAPKLGWMVGTLAIDPFDANRLLYGTGATIYGTRDLTNWDRNQTVHIAVEAAGVEQTAVFGLISPPTGAHLYSVLGDIGGFRHDDLTRAPVDMYAIPFAGTYTSIDYAELKPDVMARVGTGRPTDEPPVRSVAFTTNGGTSWFAANSEPSGMTDGAGSVAVGADGNRVLWSPQSGGVFYTSDSGKTWSKSLMTVTAHASLASDRLNPKKFYAISGSAFLVSTDGGVSFNRSAVNLTSNGRIRAAPDREGDVWFAGDDGLFRSTDSGQTFAKMAGVSKADVVGFGKAKNATAYPSIYVSAVVDGVHAIYRSDDAAVTWVRINDNDHQYGAVQCITGDPRVYGRVYFGTNGRGIIYGEPK